MTDDELQSLRRLAEAATQGRWKTLYCSHPEEGRACGVTSDQRTEHGHIVGIFQSDAHDECWHPVSAANADFIAACSPSRVLLLLAHVDELQSHINDLEDCPFPAVSHFETVAKLEASLLRTTDERHQLAVELAEVRAALVEACEVAERLSVVASNETGEKYQAEQMVRVRQLRAIGTKEGK